MRTSEKLTVSAKWEGAEHFRSCVTHWVQQIRVEPKGVELRPMRNKWASCSAKGFVTFNSQLLEERREFGEYVIVHELLHLRIPNHGRLFKSLLTAHMPDWKNRADRIAKTSCWRP